MWSNAREIAAGDVVIVWMTRDQIQPITITPGKDFNSKYGNYKHSDFIGIPYGSKVGARTGRGFIHLLRPTPELWTMALPHRTQILYLADIAFVVAHLNIGKGSKVIEAGTGSGSFSHSVARTIGETGHLWSYEFHEVRAGKAKDEFARHGLEDIITLTHQNVCKDGFTVEDTVDAVFLDLPAPWSAIEHAKKALRKDRTTRICCFSPCMEQVLRTVTALNTHGFTSITMFETLIRPHEVSYVPKLKKVGEVGEKLKESERRREEKRVRQIEANREMKEREGRAGGEGREREREGGEGKEGKKRGHEDGEGGEGEGEEEVAHKRVKTDEGPGGEGDGDVVMEDLSTPSASASASASAPAPAPAPAAAPSTTTTTTTATPAAAATPTQPQIKSTHNPKKAAPSTKGKGKGKASEAVGGEGEDEENISISCVFPEVRGHTSYLTFAVLQPFPGGTASEGLGEAEGGEGEVGPSVAESREPSGTGTPEVQVQS